MDETGSSVVVVASTTTQSNFEPNSAVAPQTFANPLPQYDTRTLPAQDEIVVTSQVIPEYITSGINRYRAPNVTKIKVGSQSDARPCVALICETQNFITKKVGGFLTT